MSVSILKGLSTAVCVAAAFILTACTGEAPSQQPPAIETANVLTLAPERGGTDYITTHLQEDPAKDTYSCDQKTSTPVELNLTDGASVMVSGVPMTVKKDADSVTFTIDGNVFTSSMVVNNNKPVKVPTDKRTEQKLTVKLKKVDFDGDVNKVEVCYHKQAPVAP